MPTLVLHFPSGRYHATPSGHHVNEGFVEWPPSPWRLVRALVACGYATLHWEEIPPEARRLVEALSRVLPEYRLPQAAFGHSRHYMPTGKLEGNRERTTLVLDTFADVANGAIWVRWPVVFDQEMQQLFDVLARHLGYLGRSESWVLAESASDEVSIPESGRVLPHSQFARPGRDFEQVTLLAPEDPATYTEWRQKELERAIHDLDLPEGKKPTKAQLKKIQGVEDTYPADLVDCLQKDTAWWKARKWGQAPGSRSVLYWREGMGSKAGATPAPRVLRVAPVESMLLALATPSGSKSALPPVARTLPQAELIHQSLVSKVLSGGEPCPELIGRDEARQPLKGPHAHAHILPMDLDGDGHLDHIIVFAPMGLSAAAQRAVRALRRTYMKGGVGELQVAVAAAGSLNDLRALGAGLHIAIERLLGPVSGATSWISATPFVPPRHLKKRGNSTLPGQIAAELEVRGYPPASVEVLPWTSKILPLRHFVRCRGRGPRPPVDAGFAVRLLFDRPVWGPICLGYGSHFGLGRFSAEDENLQ